MCRDHRPLPACQKQHRQNEPAGQVDVQQGGGMCEGESWTCVGTTDLSLKTNTDRMIQLVR